MFQGTAEWTVEEVMKIEEIKKSENINKNSELVAFGMKFLITSYDKIKGLEDGGENRGKVKKT